MKQTQLSYPTLAVSFQTTASKLPTAQARIHTLRDGELVLYKRSHSRVWQCRYKLYDNQWHRQTTGRTVLSDAVRVAGELYDEARFRERMGLAPTRKTFSQIAVLTVEEMRRDLAAGTGKKIYEDYCQVIERYFVPFFGERHRGPRDDRSTCLLPSAQGSGYVRCSQEAQYDGVSQPEVEVPRRLRQVLV
jgi:hypothetical protein